MFNVHKTMYSIPALMLRRFLYALLSRLLCGFICFINTDMTKRAHLRYMHCSFISRTLTTLFSSVCFWSGLPQTIV